MKKRIQSIVILLSCLGGNYSYAKAVHPTMILVHGALLTSRTWAPLQSELQNKGYNVVTVDTPGRLSDGVKPEEATLSKAVEKLCRVVQLQTEPVILVGHNQAGAIITQAIDQCSSNIVGLVYIAAVVPWPGEQPFDALSEEDNQHFDSIAPLDKSTGLSIPNENAPIKALFMADASDEDAKLTIHNMVPEPIVFAFNTLHYDLNQLRTIPKYYVKTTKDLIISPLSQDKFIRREPMKEVIVLNSGHAPFISQSKVLAEELIKINDALSPMRY